MNRVDMESAPMKIARVVEAAWFTLFCLLLTAVGPVWAEAPIQAAMDQIVVRLCAALSPDELMKLDQAALQPFITAEDRRALASEYWCFNVDVPVVVSVMRDVKQPGVPFWLAEAGFKKTDLSVRNEEFEYEVWQKDFDAGRVGLGINGFDKHRPHYFVAVGPQTPGTQVHLSGFYPPAQRVLEMRKGAFVYHDWSDLLLTEVPDALKGQILLPTIRGRAREAHLIDAFRKTDFPSSNKPDQVVLTWNDDPRTSQSVTWRTNPSVETGIVRYKIKNANNPAGWTELKARRQDLDDRLLLNDPRVHRFTATLRDLEPGTAYAYTIGGAVGDSQTEPAEFTTAPAGPEPFTFIFLSDTHNSPETRDLLAMATAEYPRTAFCTISGDLVGSGQYRDDWDRFLKHCGTYAAGHPLAPAMGNHDCIDGLGADLYRTVFELPADVPKGVAPECAYAFEYSNALFVMPDVTASVEGQIAWLDEKLGQSHATWKFAVFHFPPYAPDNDEPEIVKCWAPLFDKHHVDFVLSGHIHQYFRTYPIRGGKRVDSTGNGTIYITSVSVKGDGQSASNPDYIAADGPSASPLFVAFTVDGNQVSVSAQDKQGRKVDECVVKK